MPYSIILSPLTAGEGKAIRMLESPQIHTADQQDIHELQTRIAAFNSGQEDEERFKHYRLTRGVYGQRQLGVQMFRTKIPFGKLRPSQLRLVADLSEEFTNGRLHLTTRQNIQLHYVKLEDSPKIWEALAQNGMTAREACGNTVRNVTASAKAGIDPLEPFDVSPYAQATFEYFLRNPICQEMGRKIKPAFSSSELDSAFAYFHDFGFIPKIKKVDGVEKRGFKVLFAGGLGAVSIIAHTVDEFMPEEKIIPFMEAAIRVFDRYGEREKRMKARMKFLVKNLGIETVLELIKEETKALPNATVWVDKNIIPNPVIADTSNLSTAIPYDHKAYELWQKTNVIAQKQAGLFGVHIKIKLGNIDANEARALSFIAEEFASNDLRITVNQGLLFRHVSKQALPHLYVALQKIGFADAGFDSLADITACPGTDTCALGVTNSTGLSSVLENLVWTEYRDLSIGSGIKIKISGCMNACGQHMAANVGFHGSSINHDKQVIPAMQVVLGGGIDAQGKGFIADKVIKLPTKRIPNAVRFILDDFEENGDLLYFNDYYQKQGKKYFYNLLKPLANLDVIKDEDYQDWQQNHPYVRLIGVGECAGAALDVVATILQDAETKINTAHEWLEKQDWAGALYWAYSAQIVAAKALLLAEEVKCNTHHRIITDFQTHYVETELLSLEKPFPQAVLAIKKHAPTESFAITYLEEAQHFLTQCIDLRKKQLEANGGLDQPVIADYYKA